MIYLKLHQAGEQVNHKRVERLYAAARLQVKRRKCKKIPLSERKPLGRPGAANQVWSMDFVFDRTAEGRVIKNLTIVDDATHEAVAIVPGRAIDGLSLTRILNHLALQRGLPSALRTDNGLPTEPTQYAHKISLRARHRNTYSLLRLIRRNQI